MDEGCRIDWLFSNHSLGPELYWGREFGLVENAGTKPENKSKESADLIKAKKNLRDMLQSLDWSLPDRGHSCIIDEARLRIILPAITFSSWKYRAMAMLALDSSWYGLVDLGSPRLAATFAGR